MSDYFYSLEFIIMNSAEYITWTPSWYLCSDLAVEENQ